MADAGVVAEREIIGVVADIKCDSLQIEPQAEVYLPHAECAALAMTLVVRRNFDAPELAASLHDIAGEIDRNLAIGELQPMSDFLAATVAQPR